MSLVILLASYPNYPARKVRKLAQQIAYLDGINSKQAKDIGQDLMDYHLLQARTEAQLNDDVMLQVEKTAPAKWWGAPITPPTTLQGAIDEMEDMRQDWVNLAIAMGFEDFVDPQTIIQKAHELSRANKEKEDAAPPLVLSNHGG